ncbi:MAG: hypothetical protein O7G88_07720 [bacterium]|nr:hypothetical protein [bacterium]
MKQDAFYLILQHIKDGHYTMIASSVHFREVAEIEEPREQIEVMGLLNRYGTAPSCNFSDVRKRADHLHAQRLGVADAAHIAFAEATADVVITCDDQLLRRCRRIFVHGRIMNPLDFCQAENLR